MKTFAVKIATQGNTSDWDIIAGVENWSKTEVYYVTADDADAAEAKYDCYATEAYRIVSVTAA